MASFMTGGVQVTPLDRTPHLSAGNYGSPIDTLPRNHFGIDNGEGRLDTPATAQAATYAQAATSNAAPSSPTMPSGAPAGTKLFSQSDDGTIVGWAYPDGSKHFFQGGVELTNPTPKPSGQNAAGVADTQATGTLTKEGFNPVTATNMVNQTGATVLNKGFAAGGTLSPTGPKATQSITDFENTAAAANQKATGVATDIPKFNS